VGLSGATSGNGNKWVTILHRKPIDAGTWEAAPTAGTNASVDVVAYVI